MIHSNISKQKPFKIPYVSYKLLKKILFLKQNSKNEIIKTWSRASTILPIMVGYTISVYNGRKHIPLKISDQLIGYKLGEFIPTRTFKSHKKVLKKVKR
jgi:small subunit ribosomal protein S19